LSKGVLFVAKVHQPAVCFNQKFILKRNVRKVFILKLRKNFWFVWSCLLGWNLWSNQYLLGSVPRGDDGSDSTLFAWQVTYSHKNDYC